MLSRISVEWVLLIKSRTQCFSSNLLEYLNSNFTKSGNHFGNDASTFSGRITICFNLKIKLILTFYISEVCTAIE